MKIFKIKEKAFTGFAFTGLLLGLVQTSAMGVTIDLFNDVDSGTTQEVIDSTLDSTPVTDTDGSPTALTGVIGGQRTIEVNLTNQTRAGNSKLTIFTGSNSAAVFSTDTGQTATATIKWNGNYGTNGIKCKFTIYRNRYTRS
jgi:hypothetical protein